MELNKKIIIITQARFSSTRLPGKILKKIQDKTILGIHLARLKRSQLATHYIVATTYEPEAHLILDISLQHGFQAIQGSTHDVLDRFNKCLEAVGARSGDIVIRVTSDCPLNDGILIDNVINFIGLIIFKLGFFINFKNRLLLHQSRHYNL